MPTYAIGDIQGCNEQLTALNDQISVVSPNARLLFLGDLVNRGPQSLATLRMIRAMGDQAESVLGNHDLHLLAIAKGIHKPNKSDTIHEILNAPDCDELLDWLRYRPMAMFEQNYLMMHAGVVPQWTALQTMELAHEVETALRGPDWVDFLRQMYGTEPAKWDDRLQGQDRLRCIVNALTRMRFCEPDGTMEFSIKEAAGAVTPAGYMPWFALPHRKTADVTVVFGHWSTLGLISQPNVIGLDTGCLWGGKLTALCLEDRSLIQVACPQSAQHG
ncbi:MAG: symmetrical bis(5-nucleosyl)-tetraphosphatase [Herbaspirillum sp.]|nr:symmetrical bis(5-nucleosyl)-tetraphosphatase [Herbaspirillum sp.]